MSLTGVWVVRDVQGPSCEADERRALHVPSTQCCTHSLQSSQLASAQTLDTEPFPLVLLTLCVQDSWSSWVTTQVPWRVVPVALPGKLEAPATIYSPSVQSITLITIGIPSMVLEKSSNSPLLWSQSVSESATKIHIETTFYQNQYWCEGEKRGPAAWINYP